MPKDGSLKTTVSRTTHFSNPDYRNRCVAYVSPARMRQYASVWPTLRHTLWTTHILLMVVIRRAEASDPFADRLYRVYAARSFPLASPWNCGPLYYCTAVVGERAQTLVIAFTARAPAIETENIHSAINPFRLYPRTRGCLLRMRRPLIPPNVDRFYWGFQLSIRTIYRQLTWVRGGGQKLCLHSKINWR